MMLYAIMADIHGNWEALRRVVQDARRIARQEKTDLRFACLGDVIDYGPQPNECMAWVSKHCEIVVQGNHERAIVPTCNLTYSGINPDFWPITWWTCLTLEQKHQTNIQAWPKRQRMGEHILLFHGSLEYGPDSYIRDAGLAYDNLQRLPDGVRYGLFGHTHEQGYFVEDWKRATVYLTGSDGSSTRGWQTAPLGEWLEVPGRRARALLNPGSVGQPRYPNLFKGSGIRRDNRACYMLLKLNGKGKIQFRFQRVAYDVEQTINKLREIRWIKTKPSAGKAILWGEKPTNPISDNPLNQRWREVKEHPEPLYQLIEEVLIPTLDPPA